MQARFGILRETPWKPDMRDLVQTLPYEYTDGEMNAETNCEGDAIIAITTAFLIG
jgi:hypothetical protein